jgi:hypothetical protein
MPKLPKQKQFKPGGQCIRSIKSVRLVGLTNQKVGRWTWKTFINREYYTGSVAFYVGLIMRCSNPYTKRFIVTKDGISYWEQQAYSYNMDGGYRWIITRPKEDISDVGMVVKKAIQEYSLTMGV